LLEGGPAISLLPYRFQASPIGYGSTMRRLPPEEQGEIRAEVGQSLVLIGMATLVIVAGLLIGLAF
jgi:hypothetical protein